MQLTINHETPLDNPSAEQIAEAVAGLEIQDVAILSRDDLSYIQTLVDEEGMVLEYQEGSLDQHYGVVGELPSQQQVAEAFVAYAGGSDQYKRDYQWDRMDLEETDYLIVALAGSIEDGEIDWEQGFELPEVGVPAIIALYQALGGGDAEKLAQEFVVVAETSLEEVDDVRLIPLPQPLQDALAKEQDLQTLAQRWQASEAFPPDGLDQADAEEIVQVLAQLAQQAKSESKTVVICELCELE